MRRTALKPGKPLARRSKRKATGKSAPTTKAIDTLWSLIVRERAIHECQMFGCGDRACGGPMNAHHIWGRDVNVRWDLDNGLCVCWTHHLHYIHNGNQQARAQEDIREIIGPNLYEDLGKRQKLTRKNSADYRKEVFDEFTAILAKLKAAA